MIIEVIILVAGAYLGKNVKVSVSEDAQRIAKRLLQTGLAQLPIVKGWAVGAIASARSQASALPPVQEVSDEVLKEIEEDSFFGKGVTFFDDELKAAADVISHRPESVYQEIAAKTAKTVLGSK